MSRNWRVLVRNVQVQVGNVTESLCLVVGLLHCGRASHKIPRTTCKLDNYKDTVSIY